MADDNFDNEKEEVQDRIRTLWTATDAVIESMRKTGTITSSELDKIAKEANVASYQIKGFTKAVSETVETFSKIRKLGSTFADGQGKLTSFNSIIDSTAKAISGFASMFGPLGSLFGGAVEAISTGLQFVNKEFEKTYSAFIQLSKVGAAGANGISDTVSQFEKLGVPISMLTQMIGQNSEKLAGLGGTTNEAAQALAGFIGAAKRAEVGTQASDMQLRMLGFSSEEIADTFIQYADLQRRFNVQQTLDQDKLTQGSMRYGRELDAIAKLTGQSRDQLRKQMDQMMLNERFAAHIRQLQLASQEKAAQEQMVLVQSLLAMGNTKMAQATMAGLTGYLTTPEARAAAVAIPGFMRAMQQLNNNQLANAADALQTLQDGSKIATDRFSGLATAIGNQSIVTEQFNEYLNLSTRDQGQIGQVLKNARTEIQDGIKKIVEPGPGVETPTQALSNAIKSIEQSGANISSLATKAEFATNMISSMAEAVEDVTGWLNTFLTTGSLTPSASVQYQQQSVSQLGRANELLANIKQIQEQIRDQGPSGANTLSPEQITKLTGELSGLTGQLKTLREEMYRTPRVGAADTAYKTIVEYLGNSNQGSELGVVPTFRGNEWNPPALAPKMSNGGILTGPKSGYQATLHGTEAVIPLSNQRSIPVEIKDTRDSSAALSILETQIAKMDEMINELRKNTNVSEKMFRQRYS